MSRMSSCLPILNHSLVVILQANIGTVKYVPERDAILWYIPKFQGAREYLMRAHFGLPSTAGGMSFPQANFATFSVPHFLLPEDQMQAKPPITVKFEIPYFTVSGIQVRYLKIIERSGYQARRPPLLKPRVFIRPLKVTMCIIRLYHG